MTSQLSHPATAVAPDASTTTSVTRARILRTAIEIVLQDECRPGRIQPCLTRTAVLVAQRETALGLAAREPLVLKCDRKCGFRSQPSRELLHARRHLGRRSIEAARQPDDDGANAIFLGSEPRNLGRDDIERIHLETGRTEHAKRTSECAGRVADRDADSPLTDVEPHEPHG